MPQTPASVPILRLISSRLAPLLALTALVVGPMAAQEHPISWAVVRPPARITQGAVVRLALRATIPQGWHLYSITQGPGGPVPTTITTAAGAAVAITGTIRSPEPDIAEDKNFGILTETYTDSATFTVPVTALAPGRAKLALQVAYQTCTDRYCLPPTSDIVEASFDVMAAAPGAEMATPVATAVTPPTTPPAATPPATVSAAPTPPSQGVLLPGGSNTGQSLPLFLWLAAVMGALSLLTPCVFPMIPITVSYFTRTSETSGHSAARNAFTYALGIVATFTILGMAIAILVGAGGINRFAANPWVNLLVTGLFLAFALNLFGVWQVTLPSALLTKLNAASDGKRGGETAGILAMGLTFTLTSFTCTAPLVGTLLVMAAQGNWRWPLLGLLVFSAVFALPFFLLALMPRAVAKLPRSGAWLQRVKVMMGFLEVATAMKFLANADMVWQWGIFTRDVVLIVWVVTAVVAAAWLFGLFTRPRPRIAIVQQLVAVSCIAVAVWLGRGVGGTRLGELESFLPPPEGAVTSGTATVDGELPWMVNDLPAALAQAKREQKRVLVDFTGYTCTNCRWMEANMFPRPEITRELERFVRVRLYTDGQGDLYRKQQQLELDLFGTVALPYYAIMDTLGTPQAQFLGMTRSSEEYLTFLRGVAPVAVR
ncbi:MAG: thioredoxin family protein [Gemmatimonadetes bacterium]|nr:thioredoxin family protein [Gemmatimonadota bacterium]